MNQLNGIFSSVNESTMAMTLVDVPITNAHKPNMPINVFFTIIITFEQPVLCFMKTRLSIMAGNITPRMDRQNAPKNDMNKSSFGIATASKTKRE